jgi:hypothetical protein
MQLDRQAFPLGIASILRMFPPEFSEKLQFPYHAAESILLQPTSAAFDNASTAHDSATAPR